MKNAENRVPPTAGYAVTEHATRTMPRGHSSFIIHPSSFSVRGFTMVEIAISLAVIGFALVAIVGILPIGLGLQKQNRQETVVNQDASVFLDAIRSGAQGLDDLTNYVVAITNIVTTYDASWTPTKIPFIYGYTFASSGFSGVPNKWFPITNGYRIVGLLSTPMYTPGLNGRTYSNHVIAYVRSLSGLASEKFPQNNASVQDLAFSYRMMPEVTPLRLPPLPQDPNVLMNLQSNLHDLRLTFRWPLVDPKGKAGPSQQSFRSQVGGTLQETNELGFARSPTNQASPYDLYFFQPRTYVKAP